MSSQKAPPAGIPWGVVDPMPPAEIGSCQPVETLMGRAVAGLMPRPRDIEIGRPIPGWGRLVGASWGMGEWVELCGESWWWYL